jgi:tetratricopeptide (TPR) repeat protein
LARERDDAAAWLLAARLERTPAESRAMLERALRKDADSAWVNYGLAFVQSRDGNWSEAQTYLKRALELDPAHLPARRLEAALLARDGKFDAAREAFGAWLEISRSDPRIEPRLRLAAELDLALVDVQSGHSRAARARLIALADTEGSAGDAGRRLCLLAAAEQGLGKPERALEAARAAESADPSSALPRVQQALIHEQWLQDPEAAKAAWGRVLSEAQSGGDLGDLIQGMRARVVLERLDAAPAPQRGYLPYARAGRARRREHSCAPRAAGSLIHGGAAVCARTLRRRPCPARPWVGISTLAPVP